MNRFGAQDSLVRRFTLSSRHPETPAYPGEGWWRMAFDSVTADVVRTVVFHSGRLRAGYHQREVDEALDGYEEQLRKAEAW
jgi:DivIVA domain-containing protein